MDQKKNLSKQEVVPDVSYGKTQLIKSKRYQLDRDLLVAILQEDKVYTIAEVDQLIKDYKKGAVK